jgi:chemotaxis protein MotB
VQVTQLADRLSLNIVDKILFPSGEDQITDAGQEVLKRVGVVLAQARDKIIRIEGHTDNVPTGKPLRQRFPTNWELSTARATNVVRFLQDEAHIDPTSLEAVGRGEYRPIASNKTAAGRSQNRRIEIILYPRVRAIGQELAPAKAAKTQIPASKPTATQGAVKK